MDAETIAAGIAEDWIPNEKDGHTEWYGAQLEAAGLIAADIRKAMEQPAPQDARRDCPPKA